MCSRLANFETSLNRLKMRIEQRRRTSCGGRSKNRSSERQSSRSAIRGACYGRKHDCFFRFALGASPLAAGATALALGPWLIAPGRPSFRFPLVHLDQSTARGVASESAIRLRLGSAAVVSGFTLEEVAGTTSNQWSVVSGQ